MHAFCPLVLETNGLQCRITIVSELPGFCSIIFNASIAADANIGGNDAEKQ